MADDKAIPDVLVLIVSPASKEAFSERGGGHASDGVLLLGCHTGHPFPQRPVRIVMDTSRTQMSSHLNPKCHRIVDSMRQK